MYLVPDHPLVVWYQVHLQTTSYAQGHIIRSAAVLFGHQGEEKRTAAS